MRRLALAAVIALPVATPASADTLGVLYRNTLVLTDGQGRGATVLFEEGGKFEQTNAEGAWAAGFWSQKDSRFCMTARGASEICFPLEGEKSVGDTWEINGPTGRLAWTARIVEGRADLRGQDNQRNPLNP